MIKTQRKHVCLILGIVICSLISSGGCYFGKGLSAGPRDGVFPQNGFLFGIPIEFSKREKPPKRTLDELHEVMLAESGLRDTGQSDDKAEGGGATWLDGPGVPSADDWYAGITAINDPQPETPDRGIMQVSYLHRDTTQGTSQGIVTAAMTRETPPEQHNNNTAVPIPLEQDKWVANLELERFRDGKTDQPPESPWRWRHRGIEEILILPPDHQPNWQALSRHENALVRGNAIITLARAGDPQVGDAAVALVNDVSRSTAMRCAALEALASLPATKPETLVTLSDTYCDYIDANGRRRGGVPDLAIEVLYALAAKMPVTNEPCFTRPLESRDAKVRLAAVGVWRDNVPRPELPVGVPTVSLPQHYGHVTLPDRVVQYCGDSNTAIQEAALIAVARWRHPQAPACLDMGLRHPKAAVRIAAIRGLSVLQTEESVSLLTTLTNDPSAAIRAEVVAAFGRMGLYDRVYPLCDDTGWEVRKAVARELAKSDNARSHAIAQKYLRDASVQVQLATLESLRHWHPGSTAELLFDAMGGNALEPRYAATEMLAQVWEPARQYMANGRPEVRKRQYQQLAVQFQHDMQTGALHGEGRGVRDEGRGVRDEGREQEVFHERGMARSAVPGWERAAQSADDERREPLQADIDRVRMLLAQLQQGGTQQQYQNTIDQLTETGPMLLKILEQLVIAEGRPLHDAVVRQVLPDVDSLFGISCRLDDVGSIGGINDVGRRRAAVTELVGETKFGEVSPLLYRQLAAHVFRENDEIVLLRLWDLIDRQAEQLAQYDRQADQAVQRRQAMQARELTHFGEALMSVSLGHASPELHRRTCLHLREYGQPDAVPALLAEIKHPVPSVSRAALQTLAKIGTLECADSVRPLLQHAQPLVVVDAALALDRWGDPAGTNALERLTVSGDRTTKLAVVQGIKRQVQSSKCKVQSGEDQSLYTLSGIVAPAATDNRSSKYVPLLVRLLDESGAIRQEALDALPLAAGRDVVPPQEVAYYSIQERIELWKQWR